MSNLLYILAVVLVISWAIGFFVSSAGGLIHFLLFTALIAVILRVFQGKEAV